MACGFLSHVSWHYRCIDSSHDSDPASVCHWGWQSPPSCADHTDHSPGLCCRCRLGRECPGWKVNSCLSFLYTKSSPLCSSFPGHRWVKRDRIDSDRGFLRRTPGRSPCRAPADRPSWQYRPSWWSFHPSWTSLHRDPEIQSSALSFDLKMLMIMINLYEDIKHD